MELFYKLTTRKALAFAFIAFLLILAALATLVDWQNVSTMVAAADLNLLAAAVALLIAGYIAYAERWRYLLNDRANFAAVFHTANVGTMLNTLLPGRPGDAVRILLLSQRTGLPIFAATSSVVVERWYEQIMRLAALGGALIFGAGASVSTLTITGSIAYLVASLLVMIIMLRRRESVLSIAPPLIARLPRITEERARVWLTDLIDGLAGISSPSRLIGVLIRSLVTWALFWGFHYLCLVAIHPELDSNRLLAISLGSLALVPPSASTLPGVYQVSMVVPMALVGYRSSLLTTYSLIMNVAEMFVILILGIYGSLSIGLTMVQLFERARSAVADEIRSLTS